MYKMYSLIEVEAEKYLDKKHSFRKTGEKDKFIPDNVRKMLRRKLKLSKRFMASDNWLKNHETIREIEKVELSLKDEYYKKRAKEENRVLEKIEKDSSYFFKYTRRFGQKGRFHT